MTPAKIDNMAIYASIASRIPAGDEIMAFTKRTFSTWMMMDNVATSKSTINGLWYRLAGSPVTEKFDEVRNIITVSASALDREMGVKTNKQTNTEGAYVFTPLSSDRYLIIDDDEEVRE